VSDSPTISNIKANESGSAAVEFAMVGPLLIIMIVGIFSAGWLMHSIASTRYALEEAGRVMLVNADMTESELTKLVTGKLGQLSGRDVSVSLVVDDAVDGIRLAHATAEIPVKFSVPLLTEFAFSFDTSVTIPLIAP
jgi:hypothetical protein